MGDALAEGERLSVVGANLDTEGTLTDGVGICGCGDVAGDAMLEVDANEASLGGDEGGIGKGRVI